MEGMEDTVHRGREGVAQEAVGHTAPSQEAVRGDYLCSVRLLLSIQSEGLSTSATLI